MYKRWVTRKLPRPNKKKEGLLGTNIKKTSPAIENTSAVTINFAKDVKPFLTLK